MNVLKLGLISFVILFLLVTGISLFIPSHVRVSRAINMSANKDAVINQIKNPATWRNWYPGLDTAQLYYEAGVAKGVTITNPKANIIITKESADEIVAEFRSNRRPVINGWKAIEHANTDSL